MSVVLVGFIKLLWLWCCQNVKPDSIITGGRGQAVCMSLLEDAKTQSAGHWYLEPNIIDEYAPTTRHCIHCSLWMNPEDVHLQTLGSPWTRPMLNLWTGVASDFISPTPDNFLKRKPKVEVLARRFSTSESIRMHKSSCFPRAKNSSSLLETGNIHQIVIILGRVVCSCWGVIA